MLVATHHIAFDGSHQIFLRELQALYARDASVAQPPPAAIDYADFAAWQRHQGTTPSPTSSSIGSLDLAANFHARFPDRPSAAARAVEPGRARDIPSLSATLSAALADLAREEGATLFMVLLAAFDVLLARHTHQEDILVGSPVADRPTIETEALIGCFINTVVLRCDLSGHPTFRTLLARVRCRARCGRLQERAVRASRRGGPAGAQPEPKSLVSGHVHRPERPEHFELRGGATAELQDVDLGSSRFELLLSVVTGEKQLRGTFEYSTDLFDASTIQALAKRFEVLLAGVVADPTQCIHDIPILDDAQRSQLVERWNDTDVPCDTNRCMHELFEARQLLTRNRSQSSTGTGHCAMASSMPTPTAWLITCGTVVLREARRLRCFSAGASR